MTRDLHSTSVSLRAREGQILSDLVDRRLASGRRYGASPSGKGGALWRNHAAYITSVKRAFERAGYTPIAAETDAGGNCRTCGEAGACPGVHIYHTESP